MNDAPDVDLDLSSCAREPIHTPGAIQHLSSLGPNATLHASPEFPHTLDLRRV